MKALSDHIDAELREGRYPRALIDARQVLASGTATQINDHLSHMQTDDLDKLMELLNDRS